MPIYFVCSQCQQKLAISTRKAGIEVNCPRCGSAERVPTADQYSEGAASAHAPGSYYVGAAGSETGESSSSQVLAANERGDHDDDGFVLISRRVLYLQAILIAAVAAIAFAGGYLVGRASSKVDAATPNLSLDRNEATDY